MSIWDDKEVQGEESSFVKFETEGATVAGRLKTLGKYKFDDGKVAAQLEIETANGQTVTVTAGQKKLKEALMNQRPEIGDYLTITYVRSERLSGGRTLKHFKVEVQRAKDGVPASAPAPASAPF